MFPGWPKYIGAKTGGLLERPGGNNRLNGVLNGVYIRRQDISSLVEWVCAVLWQGYTTFMSYLFKIYNSKEIAHLRKEECINLHNRYQDVD